MEKLKGMGRQSLTRAFCTLLGVCLLAAPWSAAGAMPTTRPPLIDRGAQDCTQIPPEDLPPIEVSSTKKLELDVRILYESGDLALVKKHMGTTSAAFDRIAIDLDITYDRVLIPAEWKTLSGDLFPDRTSEEHWKLIKGRYGGVRPKGADVVYYFSRYWGGGLADCIGGVRFPDRSFAFGSIDYGIESTIPAPTVDEGVIAAHEIGHLLGAHHHYSNCTESIPLGLLDLQAAPCTTMSPAALTASAYFGTMERSFVRFFTAEFARD